MNGGMALSSFMKDGPVYPLLKDVIKEAQTEAPFLSIYLQFLLL